MDQDERDIWSSPDPDRDGDDDEQQQQQQRRQTSSPSSPLAKNTSASNRESVHGLYADDDLALDAGWGMPTPTPSTASTVKQPEQHDAAPAEDAAGVVAPSHQAEPQAETQDGASEPRVDSPAATPALSPPSHANGQQGASDDEFADTLDAPHASSENSKAASPAAGDDDDDDEFADFDDDAVQGQAAGAAGESSSPSAIKPAAAAAAAADDDDFGDFGDFDDFPSQSQQAGTDADFGDDDDDDAFGETQAAAPPPPPTATMSPAQPDWQTLSFKDAPSRPIASQILSILQPPLHSGGGPSDPFGAGQLPHLSSDGIRQVEGAAQVLAGESSRSIYSILAAPPALKPVDWLRSRTRRDLHISLGVPINLDEVLPAGSSSSSSRLPPLALNLDSDVPRHSGPSSAPVSDRHRGPPSRSNSGLQAPNTGVPGTTSTTRSRNNGASPSSRGSRSDSADQARKERMREKRREDLGLGPMPDVNMARVDEVCKMDEDHLSLLTLPSLRALSRELQTLTANTSLLLTHHLTLRESLQADSEMYNGLIKDLVAGAANRLASGGSSGGGSGVGRRDSSRRSTPMGMGGGGAGGGFAKRFTSGSGSGANSPRPASPFAR